MGTQAHASTHSSYSQPNRTSTSGKGTTTKTTKLTPKVVKPVQYTSKSSNYEESRTYQTNHKTSNQL